MNELITHTAQLPDAIEDLTQFVLVGKPKLNAYMLKLRTVNRLSVAQEIRNQTLEETQELANALIAAEQRIGELLLNMPTAQGRRTDMLTSGHGGTEVETKAEAVSRMGYGEREAKDYQQMAKNPEIVQKVIEEATANGEVVTKAAVMKQIQQAKEEARREAQEQISGLAETIKAQSKREAREEVEAELKALRQTNKVLKEQAEKTATVVAPEDYEQTKRQNEMLTADNERLSRERKEAIKELQDTKKTLEEVQSPDVDKLVVDEAKDSFDNFAIATYNYVRRYGGFVWAFDKWADVPAETKRNFEKAVQALSAFSQQMVNNVGGLE